MGFKNSLEWQLESVKSEAIAFLTHGSFLTGQRERYVTVYPFADMIVNGRLADNPFFPNFQKNEVFVFCNCRPKIDCRPDLLAFSLKGDIFLAEGKQRKRDNEKDALETLKKGMRELKRYSCLLKEFSQEYSQDPYQGWRSVYRKCYVEDKKHGFPELDKFISAATTLRSPNEIRDLFRRINDNFMHSKILFGLAFNDPEDVEPFFCLDAYDLMPPTTIKYKTNPSQGVENLGYLKINNEKIYNAMKQEWKSFGRLFLFGIDKNENKFRPLVPTQWWGW